MFFRNKAQGGGLDLLRKGTVFTTLNHLRKLVIICLSFLSSSNKDTIWLYHLRLGHPSFRVLEVMFPYLFQGSDISEFHCKTCELAKHNRVSFPIHNKRNSHPFHLIHSDIWDPSTIPNVSRVRWFVYLIDDCT